MYNGWAFVDVDGTLIDANDNPRPFIKEFFQGLKDLNLILVVWSGGGREYAERQIVKLDPEIYDLVDEFKWKGTPISWAHIRPVWFVDDSDFLVKERTEDGSLVFKVPFYDATIMPNDTWLLEALTSARYFYSLYKKGGHKKTLSSSG